MEKQKSIKVNMIMNTILTASNFVFPLITYSYIARVLLTEGTGKVAFVQSVLAYFSYIATLGIVGYGTRECAKVRDDRNKLSILTQELLIINLLSTVVAYIALFIAVMAVTKFQVYKALFAVMSISILLQTLGMEWLYKALEKYTYITVRSIIFKIISVILTFILVRTKDDVVMYGFLTIFTTSASNVLNFINVRKYIDFTRIKLSNLGRHLKPIMVFFMSTVIISIYGHFDAVMLGFMIGDSEVGLYNAALKMKSIVLSVSTAITSVLIPRMSVYYGHGDSKSIYSLIVKSIRVTCVLLLPLSLFVMICAKDVLLFVCGNAYIEAKNTLVILMLCCIVLSATNIFGNQILIPKGDEKRYSMSVFIGMWINLGLNTLLIPQFKATGAAFSTLMTETFNMIWMGMGCKDELKNAAKDVSFYKYIIAVGVSIAFGLFVKTFVVGLPVFFRLTIVAIAVFGIYFGILLMMCEPLIHSLKSYVIGRIKRR